MDLAAVQELLHHVTRHVRGDRESDADVAAVGAAGREDLRVDAYQLGIQVDECAAGVAAVDRSVRLQKVFEAAVAESGPSSFGGDNAGGYGLADAQGIADGKDDVA